MKIQLDYDNKRVTLESNANLKTFFKRIKNVLPDWEEWCLDCKTEIVWRTNEVVQYRDVYPYHAWWGINQPYLTCGGPSTVLGILTTSDSEPMTIDASDNQGLTYSGVVQMEL